VEEMEKWKSGKVESAAMDALITDLVHRFERGGLTRRELIQALSALMAAGTVSEPRRHKAAVQIV
jgi:hypothetical protein